MRKRVERQTKHSHLVNVVAGRDEDLLYVSFVASLNLEGADLHVWGESKRCCERSVNEVM